MFLGVSELLISFVPGKTSSVKNLRCMVLRWVNHYRFHAALGGKLDGQLPVFVIASPPDMHLAPFAVLHSHPRIRHIIVGNGLSAGDGEWIQAQVSAVPVVRLKASLKGNARTYLSHAEVIRACQKSSSADFAIQDADCFVTDPAWWNEFRLQSDSQYAAGPFYRPIHGLGAWMPDT